MKTLLFLLWLGSVTGISYYLMTESNAENRKGKALATVLKFTKGSSVKPLGSLTTKVPTAGQTLYEYDMIFTDQNSSISIQFVDGTILDLEENSQVKMMDRRGFDNEILVSLLGGKASVKGRKKAPQRVIAGTKLGPRLASAPRDLTVSKDGTYSEPGVMIGDAGKIVLKSIEALYPELAPLEGTFWTPLSLDKGLTQPLPIEYTRPSQVKIRNWRPAFVIKTKNKDYEIVDKENQPSRFDFTLPKHSIKTASLDFKIIPAFRSSDTKNDIVSSDEGEGAYVLKSLKTPKYRAISYQSHKFSKSPPWIKQKSHSSLPLSIHISKGGQLFQLADLISHQAFKINSTYREPAEGTFIVKNEKIYAYLTGSVPQEAEGLEYLKALGAELMFRGKKSSYVGNSNTIDLMAYITAKRDLFYVYRNKSVLLDKSLLKSHKSVKAFLDKFDSHFLSSKVDIIAVNK